MAHNPNVSAMTLEDLDRPVGLYNRNIDTTIDDQSLGPVAGPSGVQGRGRGASRPVESEVQMRNRLKGEYDAWYSALLDQRRQQHEALVQERYTAEMQAERRADESRYNKRVAGTEQNMHVVFDRDMANERRLLQQQMEAEWAQREAMVDGEDAQLDVEWEEERRRMHAEREAERAWYQGEIHRLRHQHPSPGFPAGPPGGPGGPGGPGPGSYPFADPRLRDAHKVEVPSLGSTTSGAMPTTREYLIYKEKLGLYLEMTGFSQPFAIGRILLKLHGRVAEYVLLPLMLHSELVKTPPVS
jgi:hypothetical protein